MWGFVEEAVKKHLAPMAEGLWQSATLWRSLALLLVVLLSAAFFFRQRVSDLLLRSERVEHDRRIFNRADEIMSEGDLHDCLDDLANHGLRPDKLRRLVGFQRYFQYEGNHFLDRRMARALQPLVGALASLHQFTGRHFFTHPNPTVDLFCLYPELKEEPPGTQGSERYWRHATELEVLVDRAAESYTKYRRAAKQYLLR